MAEPVVVYSIGFEIDDELAVWSRVVRSGDAFTVSERGMIRSAVELDDLGQLRVAAEESSAVDPVTGFASVLGASEPLIVGSTPYGAEALVGCVLAECVRVNQASVGELPVEVAIVHADGLDPYRSSLLVEAARLAGIAPDQVVLVPSSDALTRVDGDPGLGDAVGGAAAIALARRPPDDAGASAASAAAAAGAAGLAGGAAIGVATNLGAGGVASAAGSALGPAGVPLGPSGVPVAGPAGVPVAGPAGVPVAGPAGVPVAGPAGGAAPPATPSPPPPGAGASAPTPVDGGAGGAGATPTTPVDGGAGGAGATPTTPVDGGAGGAGATTPTTPVDGGAGATTPTTPVDGGAGATPAVTPSHAAEPSSSSSAMSGTGSAGVPVGRPRWIPVAVAAGAVAVIAVVAVVVLAGGDDDEPAAAPVATEVTQASPVATAIATTEVPASASTVTDAPEASTAPTATGAVAAPTAGQFDVSAFVGEWDFPCEPYIPQDGASRGRFIFAPAGPGELALAIIGVRFSDVECAVEESLDPPVDVVLTVVGETTVDGIAAFSYESEFGEGVIAVDGDTLYFGEGTSFDAVQGTRR